MIQGYPDSITKLLAPDIDRHEVLKAILEPIAARGRLCLSAVALAGSRHLVLAPEGRGARAQHDTKPVEAVSHTVCIAHYDRKEGSPGANDNTAAVLQLAEAARQLGSRGTGGWTVVFTDREEAAGSSGARGQGSCALAQALSRLFPGPLDIFIFDACGCGDTLVISTTIDRLLASGEAPAHGRARTRLHRLRRRALDAAGELSGQERCLAPTPFSDDAGFLAAGVLAQTITLLPQGEAQALLAGAGRNGRLRSALIAQEEGRTESEGSKPETWKRFHAATDSLESLSPSSFARMVRFVVALCGG